MVHWTLFIYIYLCFGHLEDGLLYCFSHLNIRMGQKCKSRFLKHCSFTDKWRNMLQNSQQLGPLARPIVNKMYDLSGEHELIECHFCRSKQPVREMSQVCPLSISLIGRVVVFGTMCPICATRQFSCSKHDVFFPSVTSWKKKTMCVFSSAFQGRERFWTEGNIVFHHHISVGVQRFVSSLKKSSI